MENAKKTTEGAETTFETLKKLLMGDPNAPRIEVIYPEEQKMPHEMYNFIVDRCFDCCVGTFDHKHLIKGEKECIEKCVHNLKNLPLHYQDTQRL